MKQLLTEQLPSSGSATHEHKWQKVSEDANSMTLVCGCGDCGATKQVPKPKLQENKQGKQLILG